MAESHNEGRVTGEIAPAETERNGRVLYGRTEMCAAQRREERGISTVEARGVGPSESLVRPSQSGPKGGIRSYPLVPRKKNYNR